MPTFGPLGEPIFHLYLAHTHTADLECTHSVAQYCYFGPHCQKPSCRIQSCRPQSARLTGPPSSSPALLGLHLARTQNTTCQMFPLGTGDYLPRWQIDGSGLAAAHTQHYKDIIAVGTIAAIYRYHGAAVQTLTAERYRLPLEKCLIIWLITSGRHWECKCRCSIRETWPRFTHWQMYYRVKIVFICTAVSVYCIEFSVEKLNVFGGVEWRLEAWARTHYRINRFEFQKGFYQAEHRVDALQQVFTKSGKQDKQKNNNLHLPQIAMKMAKNTVPPLSNRWVT